MHIIIVDDDFLVSSSLKIILEAEPDIQVVALGRHGLEAITLYEQYQPDILLMDIRMKEMDGMEAARQIIGAHPDARILLLTTFSDDEYIIRALKLGAKGYLLKQDYGSIVPALRAVCSGQTVFGHEIMQKLPSLLCRPAGFDYTAHEISKRELEVTALVAEGLSNKEIAKRLFLSEGTVRNYLSSILDKLDLRDRTQLAVFYLEHRPDPYTDSCLQKKNRDGGFS